jgi:hypothetical protein
MPTFVFIRRSKELERVRGADTDAIESTLAKYYKETAAFGGEGHSMLEPNSTIGKIVAPIAQSDYQHLEQTAQERFGNVKEGESMTALRLRFPDVAKPVNIRLNTYQTLSDVRHLICDTIESFQITPFEFMQPPAIKIKLEDENQTIEEAKLKNAVLIVKKV